MRYIEVPGRTKPVGEMWGELRIETTGEIDNKGYLILDEPLRPTDRHYVDVVIWFVKNNKSEEDAEYICQVSDLDSTRELVELKINNVYNNFNPHQPVALPTDHLQPKKKELELFLSTTYGMVSYRLRHDMRSNNLSTNRSNPHLTTINWC